ncbi:MAG: acylphosphatase [Candidatus Omnitrophota bacterium]
MGEKRIHVFYTGRVQGVGFRYTVQDIAGKLGLKGWVKNLFDGSVEVLCEGEEKKIAALLDNIKEGFLGRYIKDVQLSWEDADGDLDEFEIRP